MWCAAKITFARKMMKARAYDDLCTSAHILNICTFLDAHFRLFLGPSKCSIEQAKKLLIMPLKTTLETLPSRKCYTNVCSAFISTETLRQCSFIMSKTIKVVAFASVENEHRRIDGRLQIEEAFDFTQLKSSRYIYFIKTFSIFRMLACCKYAKQLNIEKLQTS